MFLSSRVFCSKVHVYIIIIIIIIILVLCNKVP